MLRLLPEGVSGFEWWGEGLYGELLPEEQACVARAVEKRRAEFTRGRLCARRALAALGLPERALVSGPDRAPIWPEQVVGSITHTSRYCAAAVALRGQWRGIGIDAEERDRLGPELLPMVTQPSERDWLSILPPKERAAMGTLLFSAREAFYKAQYCISRAWVDFHDVEIDVHSDTFDTRLLVDIEGVGAVGTVLSGRWVLDKDHVYTSMLISR